MQRAVIAINVMILMIMSSLILIIVFRRDHYPEPIFFLVIFAPPILAIVSTLMPMTVPSRRIAYIVSAATMVPAVWFGIWGAWGWLYATAIVVLLIATRAE